LGIKYSLVLEYHPKSTFTREPRRQYSPFVTRGGYIFISITLEIVLVFRVSLIVFVPQGGSFSIPLFPSCPADNGPQLQPRF